MNTIRMASTSESRQRKELIASSATAFVPLQKGLISSLETTPFKRTRQNPLFSVTEDLVNTYKICNPKFRGLEVLPQRVLTVPSEGVLNNGLDNEDANLICKVNDTFKMDGYVFTVLDLLGTGTFGQVFRCIRSDTKDIVAVKVVKNKPAYQAQGLLEVKVARLLNEVHDPHDERHIVRLLDSFNHHGHVCLVFELLSLSLLDVLTQNQFRGLPLVVVQRFTKQILTALVALEEADVIHCDLKPENILLVPSAAPTPSSATSSPSKSKPTEATEDSSTAMESTNQGADPSSPLKTTSTGAPTGAKSSAKLSDVKVIDFGSACFEGKTVYSYIQSRFYRSPEVLLGLPYNGAIDMWSLACVCAEMFLGLPLFPGVSQHNQLHRIVEMLGLPPDFLIEGKNGRKYFAAVEKTAVPEGAGEIGKSPQSVTVGSAGITATPATTASGTSSSSTASSSSGAESETGAPKYRIKSAEEYAAETNTAVPVLRKYLRYNRLDEVIMRCPLAQKSRMTQEQKTIETIRRHCFLDFLQGLFRLNPFERWTARQAFSHPFIQNTKFSGPYVPPLDMKTNERKLDFMVLTQRKPPPSSFEAPALTGVKAPSNFSSGSSQFTPLLLAHRRMSDPGLDHSAKGILQGGGPQLLKRGSPAHLKVTTDTPASPPSPAGSSVTESAVPFASPQMPSAEASATSSSAATTTSEPQLSPDKPPMLARARSGSGGGDHDGFAHAPRPPHSAAQGIMRVNSKGNFQQMSMAPPPPAHSSPQSSPQMQSQSLYNSGGSPQVQTQRFMQQHQQQILQQQQQAYLKQRGNAFRKAQQTQQQQQHQQGFLSQPHQQQAQPNNFAGSNPPHHGHYPVGSSLPYNNTNNNPHQQTGPYGQQPGQMGGMASSLSMHMLPAVSGMNSLPGTSLGNSYSPYGTVGSMQDGSSVIMTDFGLALMRPDMDENRRLQSQQAPAMHPVYWQQVQQMHVQQQQQQMQQMQQGGGTMYGSPVAHSSPFAYINQFATQEQNASQHVHPPQQQQHASSYAYAPTMAHLAANYANSGYAHPSQQPPQQQQQQPWPPQQAGSYDSKTTMAWRQSNQNPLHGHGHAHAHEPVLILKHSNNSQRSTVESGLTKGMAGSPQQRFFKTDSSDGSVNHNNLRRLNTRHTGKDDHRGRGGNQSSPHAVPTAGHHHPDIRRPSPAYHKDERGTHAGATTSSGMIRINTDLKVRVETPQSSVVAESFVDSPNRTSFHMLRKRDGNQSQQGTSFIEREMDRRDSFILPSGAPHGHHGHHGHQGASINSSYSNSSANSSASSRQSSRQNSADSNISTTGRSAAAARLLADYGEQQLASGEGAPTISIRVAGFSHAQAAPPPRDKPTQQESGSPRGQGRRRDPNDPRGSVGGTNGEDVLEEWDPFFEADDLSNNA